MSRVKVCSSGLAFLCGLPSLSSLVGCHLGRTFQRLLSFITAFVSNIVCGGGFPFFQEEQASSQSWKPKI